MGLKIKDTVMSPGIVIGSGDNWMLDTLIGAPGGAENKRHRYISWHCDWSGDNWMLDTLIGAPGGAENRGNRYVSWHCDWVW